MINLSYNGKSFNQRESDNYVNLGQLCATHGKRFSNWYRLNSSAEYLYALAETLTQKDTQIITPENLVIADVDAIGGNAGTWGHPLVAIEVARWISPGFGVWCNQHIKVLIESGTTSINQPAPQPQLPQRDAIAYIEAAKEVETINNLTLQQLLRDELVDELSVKRGQKRLAGNPTQYTIVKVRARELGYSTADIGNGSALGKFVAKMVHPAFVERVGKYEVKHYQINDVLDTAIKTYFGMKHSLSN